MSELEPSLEGRFRDGLFYRRRRPCRAAARAAGTACAHRGRRRHDQIQQRRRTPDDLDGIVIDCRGLAARDTQPELRGVKGEMIIVETDEVELSRPVRLIHPRWPLYVIPRGDNRFMLGATSIEAEDTGVSVRSALELLGAAYAVHPAFAEARIVEFGSGLAPGLSRQSAAHRDRQEQDRGQRALSPRLPAGAGAGGTDARLCRSAA